MINTFIDTHTDTDVVLLNEVESRACAIGKCALNDFNGEIVWELGGGGGFVKRKVVVDGLQDCFDLGGCVFSSMIKTESALRNYFLA